MQQISWNDLVYPLLVLMYVGFKAYIEPRIPANKLQILKHIADIAVSQVEQQYPHLSNSEKALQALQTAQTIGPGFISEAEYMKVNEAAVRLLPSTHGNTVQADTQITTSMPAFKSPQ